MRVVTAIETDFGNENEVTCFLAGGITNCPDWQKDVIERLSRMDGLDDLVIFNPRRENFPIHDPNASNDQIKWEFDHLQLMDIFSMFFCGGESDQPICMYELGRNLMTMHVRFPSNWVNRVAITCDNGYKRKQDVIIQTGLAFGYQESPILLYTGDDYKDLIEHHAFNIKVAHDLVKETM